MKGPAVTRPPAARAAGYQRLDGDRPRAPVAERDGGRARALEVREQPDDRRARAADERLVGARAAHVGERVLELGQQRTGRRLEVVDEQRRVGHRRARRERGDEVGAARLELGAAARQAEAVGLAEDVGRREAAVPSARRGCRTAAGRAVRAAPPRLRSPGSAAGGPARGRRRRARARSPAAARRRARPPRAPRAAAQRRRRPTRRPCPAATGIRLSISSRTGAPLQPLRAGMRPAPRARGSRRRRRGR